MIDFLFFILMKLFCNWIIYELLNIFIYKQRNTSKTALLCNIQTYLLYLVLCTLSTATVYLDLILYAIANGILKSIYYQRHRRFVIKSRSNAHMFFIIWKRCGVDTHKPTCAIRIRWKVGYVGWISAIDFVQLYYICVLRKCHKLTQFTSNYHKGM